MDYTTHNVLVRSTCYYSILRMFNPQLPSKRWDLIKLFLNASLDFWHKS